MYKVGDRVLIKKPKNIFDSPTWSTWMDVYNNTYQEVSCILKRSYGYVFKVSGIRFVFNTKWISDDKFEQHKRRLLSV